ncbi:MAG TPA: glycosyltransferase, partial [Nitriliruptorales bacterium]
LEVVVVDNASTDGSEAILRRYEARPHRHPFRVIRNPENRGFAGAVNDAIHASLGAAVLTCNPDVRPRPDHVRRVIEVLAADDRCGAVQGKLLRTVRSPTGEPVIDTTGHVAFRTRLFRNRGEGEVDRGQWDRPGEVFGVSGALALYRRSMLEDVAIPRPPGGGRSGDPRRTGGVEVFDEDLFAFWEDVDLDWRAALRGWRARYEPTAVAEHERGGAGPRRTRRVEQLNFQNRLLTLVKCDSWRALLPGSPGLVVTTALKALDLLVTVPGAFLDTREGLGLVGRMRAKRAHVHGTATVPTEQVVARWFEPFDYTGWVRTWWRRVRGVPLGSG